MPQVFLFIGWTAECPSKEKRFDFATLDAANLAFTQACDAAARVHMIPGNAFSPPQEEK